jgi:hypothetical protein
LAVHAQANPYLKYIFLFIVEQIFIKETMFIVLVLVADRGKRHSRKRFGSACEG